MTLSDYLIDLMLSVILIVGAYQFYFWCQRQAFRPSRRLGLTIDDRFPYWPSWVWIYSFLYYPMILALNFVVDSPRQFTHMAAGFLLLLALQMLCFLLFPVTTPEQWRHLNRRRGFSERFLALVHRFDATSNCFPSMHVSVAMLTAMFLAPHMGQLAYTFPALIAVSCLFTKQHYVVDLPFGAGLGWGVFQVTAALDPIFRTGAG
jgi:membrane-associated phospholipid phosphatase